MVTPFYYPTIGGTESLVEDISIKLNEIGVSTDVMTLNIYRAWMPSSRTKIEEVHGLRVIRIPAFKMPVISEKNILMINYIPKKFARFLEDYDIIHFHNDVDLTFPAFSYFIARAKIFQSHCLDVTYKIYKRNPICKHIYRNIADIYFALSNFLAEYLIDLGIPKSKIRIVPNGIDVQRFCPGDRKKVENLLIFIGRLEPKKGLPVLLRSLNHLKTRIKLVIVGPRSYDLKYSEKIISQIRKTGENTVHEVTYMGVQTTRELIRWYQRASIFVLPSFSESFPMVNLEALSCGTPVVATTVGAIPEVVRHEVNGILVPPGDPRRLADAIQYLLDNDKTRRKFGEEGRKWVVNFFSSEAVAKRFNNLYNEIVSLK